MGLTLREILTSNYFKDYKLIAGHNGVERKIHAVTAFDAPDSYKWFKGKELFVTTGYLFKDDPELFYNTIVHLNDKNAAGLCIKKGRYLDNLPEEIVDYCNKHNFPIFQIPHDVAWIDLINAVNSMVLNKYILKLNDPSILMPEDPFHHTEEKIKKIIKLLSEEISSDIMAYDLLNNHIFTCSNSCNECSRMCNSIKDIDSLWNPSFSYKKEIICDKLNIFRYTSLDEKNTSNNSWIIIPISINNSVVAYFSIFENDEKLDFYDFFAIRLSLTLIIFLYKQLYSITIIEGLMQDEFIEELLADKYLNFEGAYHKAKNLNIDLEKKYFCITIEQLNKDILLLEYKDLFSQKATSIFGNGKYFFGFLSSNKLVFFYSHQLSSSISYLEDHILGKIKRLIETLEKHLLDSSYIVGISEKTDFLYNIRSSFIESSKAIEIGRYLYPDNQIIFYNQLGPFSLFRVEFFKDGQLGYSMPELEPLDKQSDKEELLETLKVYLECNCNHTLASKKLFIHSNTVRYRIDKIQQICSIDLDDPTERLKIQLMLRFI